MKKIRNRHASKIKIDHSENGIDWKSDGQVKQLVVVEMEIHHFMVFCENIFPGNQLFWLCAHCKF